ncbi:hypothetical protein DER44DRAFT_801054 [Fusarium oxysporum]|nr:hypothetical protein DER44DRAFT_801054 [Fusarium oxysporum]
MKVRFVCITKQDSATVRRRLLQANRTRNYRNCQKAIKDTTTANHQGELSPDAIASVAENGLLELAAAMATCYPIPLSATALQRAHDRLATGLPCGFRLSAALDHPADG